MEHPPIPSWDSLHPLIIHFPVALLLIAPLFVVLGVLFTKHSRGLLAAALTLMALGTASAFLAVAAGEAAGELVDRTPEINVVLLHHEMLAERTRLIFSALTAVFAALFFAPLFLKREIKRPLLLACYAGFLLLYAGGALTLANTAHNGGRLVHEFGVRAMMPQASQAVPGQPKPNL